MSLPRFGGVFLFVCCFFLDVRGKLSFAGLSQKVMWWRVARASRRRKSLFLRAYASDFVVWQNYFCQKKEEKKKQKQNFISPGEERDGPWRQGTVPLLTPGCSRVGASLWKEPCVCDSVVCSLVLCDHVWQVCENKKQHLEEKNEISRILREAEKESLYI